MSPLGLSHLWTTLFVWLLTAVSGVALDEGGHPLAGVTVRARESGPGTRAEIRAVSGSDGRFWLAPLPPGKTWVLRAARRPLSAPPATVAAHAPLDRRLCLRLVLRAGRPAFGRVVDRQGRPVAGAQVALWAAAPRTDLAARTPPPAHSVTDSRGRFAFDRLAGAPWDLAVAADNLAPVLVRGVRPAPGRGPADLGTVVLDPGAELAGEVVDPAEQPLAGAAVQVVPDRALPAGAWAAATGPRETRTDAAGRFRVGGLEAGAPVRLRLTLAGFTPLVTGVVAAPPADPLHLVLTPAAGLSGRIVDPSGAGIAGARAVLLRAKAPDGAAAQKEQAPDGAAAPEEQAPDGAAAPAPDAPLDSAVADPEGRFVLRGVRPGIRHLVATAPGYLRSRPEALALEPGSVRDDVEVVLRRGAALAGRVTGDDGLPVAGAWVRAAEEPGTPALGGGPAGTVTDAEGRYRLDGLATGRRLIAAGHDEHPGTAVELEVAPGLHHLDLRLGAGRTVTGRVLDRAGRAVAGAEVELAAPEQTVAGASDGAGAFELRGVPPGEYRLSAARAGYAPAEAPAAVVVADQAVQGLEVVLAPGGAIAGRVVGLAAGELAAVEVWASGRQGARPGRVDFAGRYRIADLPPGDWTVHARLPGAGEGGGRDAERQAQGVAHLAPGEAEVVLDLAF